MPRIEIEEGAVSVDGAIVAEGLGIELSLVQPKMREGKITSLCERGVAEDAGRHRITFFYQNRRFSVIVDAVGTIIGRWTSSIDESLPGRPMHRPNT